MGTTFSDVKDVHLKLPDWCKEESNRLANEKQEYTETERVQIVNRFAKLNTQHGMLFI